MKTNTLRRIHRHLAVSETACATRVLLLLLFTLPALVQAEFNYTTDNGTITIIGYEGPGGAVAIPGSINGLPVTRIGNSAFYRNLDLTSVTIPASVTSIGNEAFYLCASLMDVTIGNGVTSIGNEAFRGCESLSAITVDALNPAYSSVDGVLFNKSQTLLIQCPGGRVDSYTIPNSVTSIGDDAFSGCSSLTNLTIPTSVTSIGEGVFASCISLSAIMVAALNSTYSSVDGILFNKTQTLLIQCPGGRAGSYTIPASVTSIGEEAFSGCSSLTSLTIPNTVTNIGDDAFQRCESLTSIMIPNSVTSIGDGAFSDCSSLTSMMIPDSVTSLGEGVFSNCGSLTSITIPASVTSIGDSAFSRCESLTSVMIPASVISIGEEAFFGCSSLTGVTIPASVTSIGEGVFAFCIRLSAITVSALNPVYSSVDGVLFNKSQTFLIQCPGGQAGSFIIPNNVTSIGEDAFTGCTSLSSITIPNSVTSIAEDAFQRCDRLTSIMIPNSVTSLGEEVFSFCASLTNVTIGNGVTSIGEDAFAECFRLTTVTIGNGVTSVGENAFGWCSSLTGIYFQGDAPSVLNTAFDGAANVTVYYLPGTTGWGTTFAGRPAVLLNSLRVQTSNPTFGVRTNRFGFTITGASNLVVVVEATTDLGHPAWVPVGTNTLTGGASYFSDPEWTNHPARFYRLRSP